MSRCARRSARKNLRMSSGSGATGDHRRHHERGVDHLAEAELLEEVVRSAEERYRRDLAVDRELHPPEEQPVGERELDVVERHVLLERLDGGVVAARLVADRDRDALEVRRFPHRRLRRHEHRGRRHRVRVGVELAVTGRGGDVHRPVARAADVTAASLLEGLVGAHLVGGGVLFRRVPGAVVVAELVVEALVAEVALLLGDPFLQPEVRRDHEFRHRGLLKVEPTPGRSRGGEEL